MKNITTTEPKVLWKTNCILGESTLWVNEHNSIYFVDIKNKKIFILNIKNKKKKIIKINKEIGFIAHIKKHIFILGLQGELRIQNLRTKKIIKSIYVEKDKKFNRINDGKTSPDRKLWFGTMDALERKLKNGSLYVLDKRLRLNKVDKNYIITNGPAFIDNNNFYHTESSKKIIYKIKIDKNNKIIKKKIFKKFSQKEGFPDGMTLDKNKNLWVTHYGGGCISIFNSRGKKVHKIDFPAKNITNCIFGGLNKNEVFITSALKDMSKKEIEKFKYSGSLFWLKTNMKGVISKSFNINL